MHCDSLRQFHGDCGVCPDSDKDVEQYDACISSVLKVFREGRRGGAKKLWIYIYIYVYIYNHMVISMLNLE